MKTAKIWAELCSPPDSARVEEQLTAGDVGGSPGIAQLKPIVLQLPAGVNKNHFEANMPTNRTSDAGTPCGFGKKTNRIWPRALEAQSGSQGKHMQATFKGTRICNV